MKIERSIASLKITYPIKMDSKESDSDERILKKIFIRNYIKYL